MARSRWSYAVKPERRSVALILVVIGLALVLIIETPRTPSAPPSAPPSVTSPSKDDKKTVIGALIRKELNRALLAAGVDAETLPLGADAFIVCGHGVNRVVAAQVMSSKPLMKNFRLAGIKEVNFHTSCDILSPSTFDSDHWIARYNVPAVQTRPTKGARP
jgi:hypothetical protein